MTPPDQIDLAHSSAFRLGPVMVEPALRQITAARSETLEPRVMQVLVVLAMANGAIVSRDDLVRQCWEGRIVGDDSINRVIARLRKLAEEHGDGSLRIETITKVGYRLVGQVVLTAPSQPQPLASELQAGTTADHAALNRRRMWLGGSVAAMLIIAAVFGWRAANPPPKLLQATLRIGEFKTLSAGVPAVLPAQLQSELQRKFDTATSKLITVVRAPPKDKAQAFVLAGTIRRTGDTLHYVVNLAREGTGETPISLTFDSPASEGETSLINIAGQTTEVVQCTLLGSTEARTVPLPAPTLKLWAQSCRLPDSPDRGRALSLASLRAAVKATPDFAIGWVGLANVIGSDIPDAERVAGKPAYDEAMAALATAKGLGLDNFLILNGRARLLRLRDIAKRETLLRESARRFGIESDGTAPFNYGNFLWNVGRVEDALVQNKLAVQINPQEEFVWSRAQMLRWAGRIQEADALTRRLDADLPNLEAGPIARMQGALRQGDFAVAEDAVARAKGLHPQVKAAFLQAIAALRSGNATAKAAAADRFIELAEDKETRTPMAIDVLAALGRDADALKISEATIYGPMVPSTKNLFQPALARARSLPDFARVAEEFGLTNYWRQTGHLPDFCAAGEAPAFCATLKRR